VKKWKLWAGLILLFCSGMLIGAVGTWTFVQHRVFENLSRWRPEVPKIVMKKLTHELDLEEQQKKQVATIVCEAYQDLMELRRRHKPEIDQILQRTIARMKPELSPAQQEKLDRFHAKLKEHLAKKELHAHGRPGDPSPCE
jgi:hypothetical protein